MAKTTAQPPAAAEEEGSSQRPNDSNEVVKYKGVRLRKWGKYVTEIRLPNSRERIWLGSFGTAEMAARAFDAALFCLRGAGAKFNFPEDPPKFTVGQALSPTEIRNIARSYAGRFGPAGSSSNGAAQPPLPEGEREVEFPSSNWDDGSTKDRMDWGFLDDQELILDSNSSRVFDEFEQMFSPDIGDDHMCMSWNCGDRGNDDNRHDDDGGDDGNSVNAGLWSF